MSRHRRRFLAAAVLFGAWVVALAVLAARSGQAPRAEPRLPTLTSPLGR